MNRIIAPEETIPLLAAIHRAAVAKASWTRRGGFSRRIDPIDGLLVEFMAEILPDEGLDMSLGQFPKNDTRITGLSLCLFTSQSATTVIAYNQTVSTITETAYTSYARQALATATWGAIGGGSPLASDGRKSTYPQITFPTVGATGATVNGFFIGWEATNGVATPTKCLGQANFDDGNAAILLTNDVLKVTPAIQINH